MCNYLVYNPLKDKPKQIFHNYSQALREAERIAKKELETVYVLSVEARITPDVVVSTEYHVSEIDNLT